MILTPDFTRPDRVGQALANEGYAVLDAPGLTAISACTPADWQPWSSTWDDLPADGYLKDGGRYRRRRHACFVVDRQDVTQAPHRAHWQPVEYNALHGGMERWFEPIAPAVVQSPGWSRLLRSLGEVSSRLKGERTWFVEAHQFRIDTTDGIGRPTPEGAHRDGVDLVAVFLVDRTGIKGGETRVFAAEGSSGRRFTLTQPWSVLLLDDERVIHETTPIQPLEAGGHRDTLVLTCRGGGFQGS